MPASMAGSLLTSAETGGRTPCERCTTPIVSSTLTNCGPDAVTSRSVRGAHTLKYGWSERRYWQPILNPNNSSGQYTFANTYTRANDVINTASATSPA